MLKIHVTKTNDGILIPEKEFDTIFKIAQRSEDIQIETSQFDDLLRASKTSLKFWDNQIDDEVWNNAS